MWKLYNTSNCLEALQFCNGSLIFGRLDIDHFRSIWLFALWQCSCSAMTTNWNFSSEALWPWLGVSWHSFRHTLLSSRAGHVLDISLGWTIWNWNAFTWTGLDKFTISDFSYFFMAFCLLEDLNWPYSRAQSEWWISQISRHSCFGCFTFWANEAWILLYFGTITM